MKRGISIFLAGVIAAVAFIVLYCSGEKIDFEKGSKLTRLHTDLNYLKDQNERYVYLHGVNVSGSDKFPANEDPKTFKIINDAQPTYVNKPFPLKDADTHFSQLRRLGINSIRLIMTWEAIQPDSPDSFNEAYLDYIAKIVEKANQYHIYVLMDMHQDIFSRHLVVYFNDLDPSVPMNRGYLKLMEDYGIKPDSPQGMVFALLPPYDDAVRGDGAPLWVVRRIMPEKKWDPQTGAPPPRWGSPRLLGRITKDTLTTLGELIGIELPDFLLGILQPYGPYDVDETADLMPFTNWGVNGGLSLDIQRCFAAFLAGKDAYPTLEVDGQNIQDYLQDAYTKAWIEVAKRVKNYPNVMGYDIMNEPVGAFITLGATALYFDTGSLDSVLNFLKSLLKPELARKMLDLLVSFQLLPPDNTVETKKKWGFEHANMMGILNLGLGFDKNYMQPFYEKVGAAIQATDPNAVIWIEPSLGLETILGMLGANLGGVMEMNMTKLKGINQTVYAPHWYPDIYPFIGFNAKPRDFTTLEQRFRDYAPNIESTLKKAYYSLGNIPAVLGEFGTYFNYNGIQKSKDTNYAVSKEILDNYYEGFEHLFVNHIQWCWSPENTYERGDGWNREDFSIIDPDLKPRAADAYQRPHPTFLSGKPHAMHFYSKLHYFDPSKGVVDPLNEFELKFESKETDAPTEIFVPALQYPDGFYVWLSDGFAAFDFENQMLYYYPTADEPGHVHSVRILPPLEENPAEGWSYFFKGGYVVKR